VGALPAAKLRAIVEQAHKYSFEFLEWRRANVLRQHWQVHNKGTCPACGRKLTRAYLGTTNRRTFYCDHCQPRHAKLPAARTARKPAARRQRRTP
jgi:endonuclease-8